MKEPTRRQKEVLMFISEYSLSHSYPPTIRDIGEHFGISVRAAYDHVDALRKKGKIRLDGKRSRTMEILQEDGVRAQAGFTEVPILGVVAAGRPILAEENWDGTVPVHNSFLKKNKQYFALRVEGDSMKNAGILDRDMAVLQKQSTARDGDIVAAAVDEGFTLKRFFREANRVRLQSENPGYLPIYSQDVRVLGKLAYVIRSC
jgi:repressor LexA